MDSEPRRRDERNRSRDALANLGNEPDGDSTAKAEPSHPPGKRRGQSRREEPLRSYVNPVALDINEEKLTARALSDNIGTLVADQAEYPICE
ncbi:MAG: hypothetical protein HY724_10515 [Candidatus Rokubacteria bacterium]|nr:hypothetical protein [Candidatus Rokubacteria bacterium]